MIRPRLIAALAVAAIIVGLGVCGCSAPSTHDGGVALSEGESISKQPPAAFQLSIPQEQIPADAPEAVKQHIGRLYSADAAERARGARALGYEELGALAIPFLIDLLGDDTSVGIRLDPPDVSPGYTPTPGKEAAHALAEIGEAALGPVLAVLNDEDSGGTAMAAYALGAMRARTAVEPLLRALRDGRDEVRAESASALGLIGDDRAIPALVQAADDPSIELRRAAVLALGSFHTPLVIDPLIAALGDEDWEVASIASADLGEMDLPGLEKRLIQATEDSRPAVRAGAAWALRGNESEAAVTALLALLQDEVSRVAEIAAYALGRTGSFRAVDPLIRALRDGTPRVSSAAATALEEICGRHEGLGSSASAWQQWWTRNKAKLLAEDPQVGEE